jgi:adenylate cyclase
VVVSACLRLAEAVMERLRPLSKALELVGAGTRSVRVEEAGSRDFIEVSQRFNQMVTALERSERMERAFGVYVSGQVLELIRAQHGEAAIPAALRDASVFFADIRGFTSLSERLSPEAVVGFLNRYFARVVQVVDRHQGYLNKFIGDAVVVVFNGPMDQPDHATRAMRCALELQGEVRAMNEAKAFPELGELRVGVGIATGPMVCGNIGSPTQMEYTVIGDTVNLSARLTSHAGATEVWASEATVANLPADLQATALEPIKVKGKEKPVTPFRVTRRS